MRLPLFAAVVFRDEAFTYEKTTEVEKVQRVKHVLFFTSWFLTYETNVPWPLKQLFKQKKESIPPFLVDVVTDDYFGEHLKLVEKDMELLDQIYGILNEQREKIMTKLSNLKFHMKTIRSSTWKTSQQNRNKNHSEPLS
jgi:hypothetical protein